MQRGSTSHEKNRGYKVIKRLKKMGAVSQLVLLNWKAECEGRLRCERDHWEWQSGADEGIVCVKTTSSLLLAEGGCWKPCRELHRYFILYWLSWLRTSWIKQGVLCNMTQSDSSAMAAPLNLFDRSSRISWRERVMWMWLSRPLCGAQLHNWLAVGFLEII